MPEPQSGVTPAPSPASTQLHDAARNLREANYIGPEARRDLAALADKLADALDSGDTPSGEATEVARSAAGLIEALHQRKGATLLAEARDRLERAIVKAEVRAPVVVGLARQLIDALASIGI